MGDALTVNHLTCELLLSNEEIVCAQISVPIGPAILSSSCFPVKDVWFLVVDEEDNSHALVSELDEIVFLATTAS